MKKLQFGEDKMSNIKFHVNQIHSAVLQNKRIMCHAIKVILCHKESDKRCVG